MTSIVAVFRDLWGNASSSALHSPLQGEAAEIEKDLIDHGYSFGFDIPGLGARVYQKRSQKRVGDEEFIGQVWIYSGQIGPTPKDGQIALCLCVGMDNGDVGSAGMIGPWTFAEYLAHPRSILNVKRPALNMPASAPVCRK